MPHDGRGPFLVHHTCMAPWQVLFRSQAAQPCHQPGAKCPDTLHSVHPPAPSATAARAHAQPRIHTLRSTCGKCAAHLAAALPIHQKNSINVASMRARDAPSGPHPRCMNPSPKQCMHYTHALHSSWCITSHAHLPAAPPYCVNRYLLSTHGGHKAPSDRHMCRSAALAQGLRRAPRAFLRPAQTTLTPSSHAPLATQPTARRRGGMSGPRMVPRRATSRTRAAHRAANPASSGHARSGTFTAAFVYSKQPG